MYQSFLVATRQPHERFDYFSEVVSTLFCPMELEPLPTWRAPFDGTIEAADLGSLHMARVSTAPLLVRRRERDIARIDDPPYLVKFQLKGESLWCQRGREVHMRPGDFVIGSTAEPYSLTFRGHYEMPVLVVPQSIMRGFTPDPDQFLGVRMPGEDADCGLLSSFVAQVVSRLGRLSEHMVRRVETNIIDLLGGVLTARAQRGSVTRPQLLALMKTFIAEHLGDRRLGPEMIAAAFGVSTRHVHAVFKDEGVTVGRYIRSLRVAACRRALESAESERVSLTEIALNWGFYDLSHMTRCFREEYGEPPRRFLMRLHDS